MKILFIVLLVLNFLMEAMAAVALISTADSTLAATTGMWSMHYGFAALAIASLSLWVWPHRNNLQAVTVALGVLLTFHTGLAISLFIEGAQMGGAIGHAVLSILSAIAFLQKSKIPGQADA